MPTSPFIAPSPFIILAKICQPPRLFLPPLLFETREYWNMWWTHEIFQSIRWWPVIKLVTLIHEHSYLILLEILVSYWKIRIFQETQVNLLEKPDIMYPSQNFKYWISWANLWNYFQWGPRFFPKITWDKVSFWPECRTFSFIGRGGIIWDRGGTFRKITDRGSYRGTSHQGTWTGFSTDWH